jgi:predicted nucleic acid-binding protein
MNIIVVSDTNVFIDLISIGLQEQFFQLPMEIHTTDMVVFEVKRRGQSDIMKDLIKRCCIKVKTHTPEEMLPFFQSEHKRYNLSPADYSVLTYSKNNSYVLLTGDGNLRKVALSEGVEVHGTIYVVAEMVEHHILTELQGAMKLEMLLGNNQRLPKSIINRLIEKWRGSL